MVRRWVRRAGIFVAVIILLLIGVVLFLHTTAGKSVVRNKLQSFLQEKWKTEVVIRNVDYRLPDWIALEGLTILDAKKDTVLNGGRLYVEINLLKLLSNKLDVTAIFLDDISIYCHRGKNDASFNFQFIIDAFAPASTDTMTNPEVTPMHISLKELRLKNVRMNYQDQKGELYFTAFINHLSALPAVLRPEKSEFNLHDFSLQNTSVVMIDSSASGSTTETSNTGSEDPAALLIALGNLKLENVSFLYNRPFHKTDQSFRVDNLQLNQVLFNLAGRDINVENLKLSRSYVRLNSWNPAQKEIKELNEALPGNNNEKWKIAVKTISLTDNSFISENAATLRKSGFDFEHIDAQMINLNTNNNSFGSSGFSSDVSSGSLLYNNQLLIKQVSANVRISGNLVNVQDLKTAFNQSQVKIDGDVTWPLNPDNSSQFRIEELSVYYSDLLWIHPALKKLLPVSLQPSDKISLSGNFSGTPRGIKAEELMLSFSGNQLSLTGRIDLKIEKAGPDISADIQQLKLNKQLLSKNLLQQLLEKNIHLPEELLMEGKVQLNSQRIGTNLKLSSSYGELLINGTARNIQNPQHLDYRFALDAKHFETGKWIGLDSVLGKITGRILIKGKGIRPKNMTATTKLVLGSAVINNYPFQNIQLQAGLNEGGYNLRSIIHDPNLETDIELKGRIYPAFAVNGTIVIENADLFKLGITSDSLQYAGNIYVDASYDRSGKMDALLRADNNIVGVRGRKIFTDSLMLTGRSDADTVQVNFHAPFMDAQLAGNYPVDSLASEVSSFLKVIYPLQQKPEEKNTKPYTSNHSSSLDVVIRQDSLLKSFFPGLDLKQPLHLLAKHAPGEREYSLGIQLTAPELSYGKMEIRDWQVKAKKLDSAVQFLLTGSELLFGKQKLSGADISAEMQKGLLTINAGINDSAGTKYFAAKVRLEKENNGMIIRLLDDVTLNRNQWFVSPENSIHIMDTGLVIHQLQLESRGQKILIKTKDQQPSSPIDIRLDSFDLAHASRFIFPEDSIGAGGIINANFSISQPIEKIPVVTGDIRASNLSLFNTPLGNFQFHSANIDDSLLFEGNLSGVNQMDFNGGLHLKDKGIFFQSRLQKLNLEIVQALTKDIFAHLSGKITGELGLTGFLNAPRYKGAVYFDSTRFSLLSLNTIYRINRQKLLIDHPDLHLENFTVSDSMDNKLNITGRIGLFSPGKKNLDLAINTKDFLWLNAKRTPEVSLFGKGIIDATLSIKGTFDAPLVVGDAYLKKNSEIYLVPATNSKVKKTRTDGIMFVDIDTIGSPKSIITEPATDSVLTQKKMKGLKYDLDLKVDKDAKFSMVIDPSNSDELMMSGDARLKAGVAENGNIGIEGVYNLQAGYYKINNLLLRGKFLLVKGSSISFSGNPSLAEADVTTEYVVEASPKGLLNYKDADDAAYSQRVPFGVIFKIKGPVSKPTLSFDIQLKSGKGVLKSSVKSDVEHALDRLRTDVTEMNKQVFSLLLTKRFSVTSGNNSLENSNLNANNALKEGVSSFLSEAMNQVADQLITGVDVEVNMKTYKTDDDPISKTDLGVAVSKGLMEDRLVIRVEENFPVGNSSTPVKSGSQYIPDITSTYKLSKDGRLQLQGYQRNEYDAVVQGYFTEIGVSFIIEVSYDKFNELLRRRKNLADEKK